MTESVHIASINPDEVNHMLGARFYSIDKQLLGSKVLFQLDDLSPDLFLVVYLEKTLRAVDVDHAVDDMLKVSFWALSLLLPFSRRAAVWHAQEQSPVQGGGRRAHQRIAPGRLSSALCVHGAQPV